MILINSIIDITSFEDLINLVRPVFFLKLFIILGVVPALAAFYLQRFFSKQVDHDTHIRQLMFAGDTSLRFPIANDVLMDPETDSRLFRIMNPFGDEATISAKVVEREKERIIMRALLRASWAKKISVGFKLIVEPIFKIDFAFIQVHVIPSITVIKVAEVIGTAFTKVRKVFSFKTITSGVVLCIKEKISLSIKKFMIVIEIRAIIIVNLSQKTFKNCWIFLRGEIQPARGSPAT